MTAVVSIYGASDDLIEVEGAPKGCDEYSGSEEPRRVILLPSGDVFRVVYGDGERGVWKVEHEINTGFLSVTIERAPDGDDPDPYTDRATIVGEIERVEVWDAWPPSMDEIRERIETMLDREPPDEWDDAKTRRVWEALRD